MIRTFKSTAGILLLIIGAPQSAFGIPYLEAREGERSEPEGAGPPCRALGGSRVGIYRLQRPHEAGPGTPRREPPNNALAPNKREAVPDTLHSERFVDKVLREVFAALLDEDSYLSSIRTMYRILDDEGEVRERRDQVQWSNYKKPRLLAAAPDLVWSWDITKLCAYSFWEYSCLGLKRPKPSFRIDSKTQ